MRAFFKNCGKMHVTLSWHFFQFSGTEYIQTFRRPSSPRPSCKTQTLPSLASAVLLSVCLNLTKMEPHCVCPLWLAYFTQHVFSAHPCCGVSLNLLPFVAEDFIVSKCHISSICAFNSEHSGCFHFLAVVNNANKWVYKFVSLLKIFFPFKIFKLKRYGLFLKGDF